MTITQQAYGKAIKVLEKCAKKTGFYASGLPGGYEATWARDSMITSLGAALVSEKFKQPFSDSLKLLTKHQSGLGQIPNCVGSYNIERRSDITFNSIDSTLWYIIGHYVYANAYQDTSLIKKYQQNIAQALIWLKYQDPNEDKIITQQPTMDWMDAFPHKYGRVLNTQALHYAVLRLVADNKGAKYIRLIINGETQKYLSLYDGQLGYYRSWIWKDHDGDRESEAWFDSLGNLLAIITELATPKIAQRILRYIDKKKINQPFACKTIWPPIKPGDKEWHSYFSKCDARVPYHYSNAGVWPFIGGFYIAALVKMKQYRKAQVELARLAQANMQKLRGFEFNEWLDGRTGKPKGEPYQAWSAGTYIYAYECVQRSRVLFFG
ncbi:MAG: amylo-alpha-1,6-glucosidase [Patescibacteria group bacterium]